MSDNTGIEWTGSTWLLWPGCIPKSAGCQRCYAIRDAWRLAYNPNPRVSAPYRHIVKKVLADGTEILGGDDHPRRHEKGTLKFTGLTRFLPDVLGLPLRWKKGRKIFVSANSDLFLPARVDTEEGRRQIAAVFGVMDACPQHTFQVLTKWPEKAAEWFAWLAKHGINGSCRHGLANVCFEQYEAGRCPVSVAVAPDTWPLSNVWIGASVEDRKAKTRIVDLRQLPAAKRFLSLEPLLEDLGDLDLSGIDQAIVGGESGPGARPCDVAWIRSIVAQCRAQGVAPFVKQLGTNPRGIGLVKLRSRKGGDLEDLPEDLRIREFPKEAA